MLNNADGERAHDHLRHERPTHLRERLYVRDVINPSW